MAWVTKIAADEQVDYRLREHAGCFVAMTADGPEDAQVEYRMRPERDGTLVWMGSGLKAVGLTAGRTLDEDAKQAARMLMRGCHPATGARLVPAELRAHPSAKLAGARLLEALDKAAAQAGVEDTAQLLDGKPKQQRQLATLRRMVNRFGEAHRVQLDTLHRLARAAGLDLADVYGATELAEARTHEADRVDVRVRGWDVVADLPKSVSTVFALMPKADEADLRALVHQAKREAFAELERWIGYAVSSDDGKPVRIATGGLLGWSVEHQSARPVDDTPGDPHLHVHIVVANLALCEDGKWRSIANSGQDLHRHAKAFDALFKARVRTLTYERFGMRYEQDERTRAWEVVGVPERLRHAFSRRAAQVDARVGAEASREEKLRASAGTRRAKHDTGTIDLRASWRQRAEAAGIDVDAMVAEAAPGRPGPDGGIGLDGPGGGPQLPPPDRIAATVFDPEGGLTANEKEFSRAQLLAAVANALPYGLGAEPGRLEQLADQVLRVEGYAVALPHRGSTVMTSTDRYTTADIVQAEQVIVDQARARFADGTARLTADQARTAIDVFQVANGFELSNQQRAVVTRLLTAGHGIDAVIGVAGAGKTTLMEACRIGWSAAGLTYAGAALSAVAAANLETGSGIPSRTVAAWVKRIREGDGLTGVDVLVVDEATMTDDRQVAILLTEAARTGTKVIAIGDPLQLQAVGPGGSFAEIHRIVGGEILTENRRQNHVVERAALEVWRTGDREQTLRMLADGGHVHAVETAEEAHAQILSLWNELRGQFPDPHDLLENLVVLAARNADVDVLNNTAQQIRREASELGDQHTYALPGGQKLNLAVGDLVRVRVNDYRSRRDPAQPDVLNGYRAQVTAIDDHHNVQINWRKHTDDGPQYLTAWLAPQQIASGALSLGYAMTIAASQGLTCHTALAYGHGANAYALYPGITRAREANHLWLPLAVLEDDDIRSRLGEARGEAELLQRAVTAYAKLLKQDRPASMVSDQLRPPPEPAAPAGEAARAEIPAPRPEPSFKERTEARRQLIADLRARYTGQHGDESQDAPEPDQQAPGWRERPYGGVPEGALLPRAEKADQQAARARQAAAELTAQAEHLRGLLGTDAAPGRQTYARIAAHLEAAEDNLARADRTDQRADGIDGQIRAMYEANHKELDVQRRIRERAALKRSALLGQRKGLRSDADELGKRIDERTEQIKALRQQATELCGEAEQLRGQARADVDAAEGGTSYRPLDQRIAEQRARLPQLAERLDRSDRQRYERLVQQSTEQTGTAEKQTARAAGLREEATLRHHLPTSQKVQEAKERTEAHRQEAKRKAAEQARLAEQRRQQQEQYRYRPPSPGRSGPRLGR